MNISIFGLGYVGIVTACCLVKSGHTVIGVDVNKAKVDMINYGVAPIIEKDVKELLKYGKENELIRATSNAKEAILETEMSFICVGTPSKRNGSLDTKYIENVCVNIGNALKYKAEHHILVFRSTMIPGTMRDLGVKTLERVSGKKSNEHFRVAYNPEFLREGTAVSDYFNPPKTVVGSDCEETTNKVLKIYEELPANKIKTTIEIAEMVKYVDNSFHALKISFANEIGRICKSIELDSRDVMNIFMQDRKLNISEAYLKPGFAFGGSCLPKDLRAISYMAKMIDVEIPVLNSILLSNNTHIITAINEIMSFGKKKIGVAGISFKEDTDDLRESPMLDVIEGLIGKGYEIKIYDKNVSIAGLVGANKEYIINKISHISALMVSSLDELMDFSEVIVIGNNDKEFNRITEEDTQYTIYDLVGLGDGKNEDGKYQGICW